MPFEFRLSSGAFGLPAGARSVDWMVLNNTGTEQAIRVTVFAAPVGIPKHQLPPGPVEVDVPARTLTHNANSVGPGERFEPGMPVEIRLFHRPRTLGATLGELDESVVCRDQAAT